MFAQLAKSSVIHLYVTLTSCQMICPCPKHCEMFRNMVLFLRGFVSMKPNLEAGGPPPVSRPQLLIQYIRRYSSYLEAVPRSATWWRGMLWWQGPSYHYSSQLEDIGVDGRIILKLIFRKYDGGLGWIGLAQDWWRALVNAVMNLRVP
jgi:hypothetical protein